jgi:hypothetical protein
VKSVALQSSGDRFLFSLSDIHPFQPAKTMWIVGQDRDLDLTTHAMGPHDLAHDQVTGLRILNDLS